MAEFAYGIYSWLSKIGAGPPGTTTTLSSGGASTFASILDFSKVRWYEYETNTSDAGLGDTTSKMRVDFGVDYNGTKASKLTSSSSIKIGDTLMDSLTEMYSDPATGKTLGGHMLYKTNGTITSDSPIAPTEPNALLGNFSFTNPFWAYNGSGLKNAGIETVKVLAGTYTATKYTFSDGNGFGVIVWAAPGVPIPVKLTTSTPATAISIELTGWG